MFVIIAICQDAPLCHLFVKPLKTLCQICHLRKFVIVLKIANYMHLFVISFEYLAKPLMNFWHTRYICGNLPFVNIAFLPPHLRFCQIMDGFLLNSPFSQISHFCENRQLTICLFCCVVISILAKFAGFAKYVIFVKPTIIDIPLLSSCFNICQT